MNLGVRRARAAVLVTAILGSGIHPGVASSDVTTTLVSRSQSAQANGESTRPEVSASGRFVAFDSAASNLVAGDTNNHRDVFVTDRATGSIERASVASGGSQSGGVGIGNTHPSLSGDGAVVAFTTDVEGLTPASLASTQVILRDRAAAQTEHVSRAWGPIAPGAPARHPSVSADGRFVVYLQGATDAEDVTYPQAVLYDRDARTHEIVSRAYDGSIAAQGVHDAPPAISPDGRFVVFASASPDLAGPFGINVFLRDRLAGTTQIVSLDSNEAIKGGGWAMPGQEVPRLDVTADGRYVMFESPSTGLVVGDQNNAQDVFVRDMQAGTTERASVSAFSRELNGPSTGGALSEDGRLVAFASSASDAVQGDSNGVSDVFMRDRNLGTTTRASIGVLGQQADGPSTRPALSANGVAVVFASNATNLVEGDLNVVADVFARAPVPAPLPPRPVITSPRDGVTMRSNDVAVDGTAGAGTAVTIVVDGADAGSTPVDPDGKWREELQLSDGVHSIAAFATNADGERSGLADPVSIRIETGPIAPTIAAPANGAALRTTEVDIEGAADPGTTVRVYEGETVVGTSLTDGAGAWRLTASFTEGTHSIVAVAATNTDTSEPSAARSFAVDVSAPAAPSIDSPAQGATLHDPQVTISGRAEPRAHVEVLRGGDLLGRSLVSSSGRWTLSFTLPNGAHEITARALDNAGNQSLTSPVRAFSIDADTRPPEVRVDDPDVPVILTMTDAVITGSARDDARVDRVDLTYVPTAGTMQKHTARCEECGSAAEVTWSAETLVLPGRYKVGATAFDARGNRSPTAWIDVVII